MKKTFLAACILGISATASASIPGSLFEENVYSFGPVSLGEKVPSHFKKVNVDEFLVLAHQESIKECSIFRKDYGYTNVENNAKSNKSSMYWKSGKLDVHDNQFYVYENGNEKHFVISDSLNRVAKAWGKSDKSIEVADLKNRYSQHYINLAANNTDDYHGVDINNIRLTSSVVSEYKLSETNVRTKNMSLSYSDDGNNLGLTEKTYVSPPDNMFKTKKTSLDYIDYQIEVRDRNKIGYEQHGLMDMLIVNMISFENVPECGFSKYDMHSPRYIHSHSYHTLSRNMYGFEQRALGNLEGVRKAMNDTWYGAFDGMKPYNFASYVHYLRSETDFMLVDIDKIFGRD